MSAATSYTLTDSERDRLGKVQRFGTQGAAGVTNLMGMLADPSWVVRRAVVQTLADAGQISIDQLSHILTGTRDSEAELAATVDALVASTGNAEAAVLALASHPNPAVVADVVQILGRRRNTASVPTLVQLTKHTDDNVAVGALEALGRIGGRAAVEALIDTVGTGNFFRTFPAIDVLGRSGDPRAVAPLAELLKNPTYLTEAARALGRSGEKSAVKPLLDLLAAHSESVVRVTAAALWDLRERSEEKSAGSGILIDEWLRSQVGSEAVRRLARALPNGDTAEAIALCQLLGAVGKLEAADALTTALDHSPQVAVYAAQALKKIGKDGDDRLSQAIREGNSQQRKVLLPLVNRSLALTDVSDCLNDPDAEVRSLACDTLARIGDGSLVAKIFALLGDANLRVVHAATAAIQALGTREARRLAMEAARSENAIVRRSALRIPGYFGDAEGLPALLGGISDPDPRVREAALQGLPYLEDPRAIEALSDATRNLEAKTRGLAMRSLGQVPKASERIFSILLKALSDRDAWVRYYACQSLGRLGYNDGAPEIARLLGDEAGQVRVSAVEALSHLNSPVAHAALRGAVDFDDIDVRRASLVGLGIARRPEDLQLLLNAAGGADVSTRLIALSALANFHSPLVLGALGAAGSDPEEQIRSVAVGFLAARPEQEATELLIHLLEADKTREIARTALLVPSQSRISGLLIALHSANDQMAPVLTSVLSRIDRADARNALLSAMKFENVPARKAAAGALASRRDLERTLALQEAADHDPDLEVRKICSLLLRD